MRFTLFCFAWLLLTGFSAASASDDPMLAHEFRREGPWFEGWYTRITDHKSGVSVAVITTSAIHNNQVVVSKIPGYVALAIQTRDLGKTISYEAFPKETRIGNEGQDFRWSSPEHGGASKAWTDIAIENRARLQIKIKSRTSWGTAGGPEGLLGKLPFMPLHWYVFNTVGEADYALDYELNGKLVHLEGTGFVHQEKNWGETFPMSWMWGQAVSEDKSAYLAFAGGRLKIGPLTAHSYMLGYRSKNRSIDFRFANGLTSSFVDDIDSCRRTFKLEANNDSYKLQLVASAPPETFAPLAIPTETGYETNGAIESFDAKIHVKLYEKTGSIYMPSYKLVETRTFRQAALEFGALAMRCRK